MKKSVSFFLLIINLMIAVMTFSADSSNEADYLSMNHFSVSLFRNLKGFDEWKKDFVQEEQKEYSRVVLKNFDQAVSKLRDKIDKRLNFLKTIELSSKHIKQIWIPVLFIKQGEASEPKIQVYCNGLVLKPTSSETIDEITVYYYNKKKDSDQIMKSFQSFSLVLLTFSDYIYNQRIILSIENEGEASFPIYIGPGLLPKNLLD